MVAPFAGAWIEIKWYISICNLYRVAPFAGAWIEIDRQERGRITITLSLPSRERGLKSAKVFPIDSAAFVAPFAGAWIEIKIFVTKFRSPWCRSLRGSVD